MILIFIEINYKFLAHYSETLNLFVALVKYSSKHQLFSLKKELFHFFKIHVLAVPEALRAISLVTVNAEVAVLVPGEHVLASVAFGSSIFLNLGYHRLLVFICAVSVFVNALLL